jgi:membrane peptidoglycan carboxypeptidase
MMAFILNQNMTKDLQLQLYISSSYMGAYDGRQIIGLPAAAKAYFNKPIADLSDDEFIVLVAMLKAPNYFHPEKGAKHLEGRIYKIKKILAGTCKPDGWFDTKYTHCANSA